MKQIRNIIRYLIVIILDIFIMYVFHSYVNLLLLVGLVLFPFYSVYGIRKIKQSLRLEIFVPEEPMGKGEEFYVRFLLHNPTWFPLVNATLCLIVENRFYKEMGIHYLNVPIRARKDTEASYPILMDYCGRFGVTVDSIRLLDLLGIYEVTIPMEESRECLVFPSGKERSQEAGQIYMKGVTEAAESKEKGYDFSEVSGIREYIPGDKLQNIHWKLSVKKDELMVKERISVSAMQLNVLVELSNDNEMQLEDILELADSITRGFVSQNLPFTVYYYSVNQGQLKDCYIGSEIERTQWLEMLLYDQSYSGRDQAENIFLQQNPNSGTYLYIGAGTGAGNSDSAMIGNRQAIAELRNY